MPELRKIRESFTKKVAQDIFDILTPTHMTGRSTHTNVKNLTKVEKDKSGADIPFLVGQTSRTSIDDVDSYNRIPSDRAQDAIVYFIEEILKLDELGLKVSVQNKKGSKSSEPEEVFQKQYVLVADENGVRYRLTITHTFLRIEERSFRPSATKTKKTKKPVYQLCWKPIRAIKDHANFELISYPTENVIYNSRANTVERIPFTDDSLTRWESATEIGKSNLISMAIDLRNTCYLVLFDGQEPYQALLESNTLKYFKFVNDLIYAQTKLDPFHFRTVGEEIQVRVSPKIQPQIIPESETRLDDFYISDSAFGNDFAITNMQFIPTKIGSTPSPIFRIDVVDSVGVEQLLFTNPKDDKEILAQKKHLRALSETALKNRMPTTEMASTIPFRSIFLLDGKCFYDVQYRKTERQIHKEKTHIKVISPDIKVGSRIPKQTKTSVVQNTFVFYIQHISKNSVAFMFAPKNDKQLVDYVESKQLGSQFQMDYEGLAFIGVMYYEQNSKTLEPSELSIELLNIWVSEKQKNHEQNISKTMMLEWGSLFFYFLKTFAELYRIESSSANLYMLSDIAKKADSEYTNLSDADFSYILKSVLFVDGQRHNDDIIYEKQELVPATKK